MISFITWFDSLPYPCGLGLNSFSEHFVRDSSLRNFQGCITVQLSRFLCVASFDATLLFYHAIFSLSTPFFNFFKTFFWFSFLRSFFLIGILAVDFHINTIQLCCQHVFQNIFYGIFGTKKQDTSCLLRRKHRTEKEGFEPSRRVSDLYP